MGEFVSNTETEMQLQKHYERIELELADAADKLCMVEQLVDLEAELGNVQHILLIVENDARAVENFRLSALSRAVNLLLGQVIAARKVHPDTYAYLVYAVKTIVKLTSASKYAVATGFEAPFAAYGEAIGAIIDHTDELSAPHMRG